MRRHLYRWLSMALWLGPVAALCGWTGSSALPTRSDEARGGSLCTTGTAATRAAPPGVGALAQSSRQSRRAGTNGARDAAGARCGQSLQRHRARSIEPSGGGALSRVYVPNRRSNSVYVIDPATLAIVDRFPVGASPQHVVPSWDLKTLWVANNGSRRSSGSLTPIDPKTASPAPPIPVDDPYNLYFTPDGRAAIVVAERHKRLDFRDPQTMALQQSIDAPNCSGINHADFSIDGRYAIFTCEFRGGGLVKIDLVNRKVLGYLRFPRRRNAPGHPHLTRRQHASTWPTCTPTASTSSTATASPRPTSSRPGSAPTGSTRAATARSSTSPTAARTRPAGRRTARAASSVIDFATGKVEHTWPIPGGGSPDMGNVSADGKQLWLSGRFDNVVYEIDTDERRGKEHPGRPGAARPDGMAAARPLFARPHRQHALTFVVIARSEATKQSRASNTPGPRLLRSARNDSMPL